MSDVMIRVENLSKQYHIASAGNNQDTIRDQLTHSLKSVFRRNGSPPRGTQTFWALKDVSFEVGQGEIVGIIGQNGAGKSTLLKILSRITMPTFGQAEIYGRVASLLEVGTGFHPELTGRENIYLSGATIGMKKDEIRRHFDAIVAFAEVEKFLDVPVKRYSSGMYVRLAFAVSAHLRPEILMLDEVLSVGDLQFQRKCMAYVEDLQRKKATILFVSHSMFTIKAICNRVILFSEGRVRFDGLPGDAIQMYEGESKLNELSLAEKAIGADSSEWDVFINDLETCDEAGNPRTVFDFGERMRVHIKFDVRRTISAPNFLVSFIRSDGVACCNYNTTMDGVHVPALRNDGVIELLTPPLKLVSDAYDICVLVRDRNFERLYCAQMGKRFHVRHHILNTHFGVFHEKAEWFLPGEEKGCEVTSERGGQCGD
jgi:lipopolysaccharide transport system ATP-binding protein